MRCQTFMPMIWTHRRRLDNSFFIYFYFVVFLVVISVIVDECSSNVCHVGVDASCTCNNSNTKGVQCLTKELNDSCSREVSARKSYRLFCEVMSQFDCTTKYSVKWNCTDCLDAYTNWLLAVFSPNQTWFSDCAGNQTTRSVFALCEVILAKCPYFIPDNAYGDLPAFDCLSEEHGDDQIGEHLPCSRPGNTMSTEANMTDG